MKIVVRVSSNEVTGKLKEVMRKVRNPTAANKAISVWLFRWVNQNFKTQGGKVGGWKPFKLGGRKLPGGGIDTSAKLLQDTGRLRASFSPFYGRNFAGIGTDIRYSTFHELGVPQRNLPSRRMLPNASDNEAMNAIIKIYDRFIQKAIR